MECGLTNLESPILLQEMIDYIECHLLEEAVLEQLSKQFYRNKNTMNLMFRLLTNLTINEYIRNRRLSLAAMEIQTTKIPIIDIAFKYGYETPEAFTKAFTRVYSFPPSFIRRSNPKLRCFEPIQIKVYRQGGWTDENLTKKCENGQELQHPTLYNELIHSEAMHKKVWVHIQSKEYERMELWSDLLELLQQLKEAKFQFKVDGKTTIFVHGFEFDVERICLTFLWRDQDKVMKFFQKDGGFTEGYPGFHYFDVMYGKMNVRCMAYQVYDGMEELEALYKDAELIEADGILFFAQSLEFYYENAKPEEPYDSFVKQFLGR